MSSIELFKLIDNPFKILDHKEINSPVWAGFPEIKQKIENEINGREYYYIPEGNLAELECNINDGDLISITTNIKGLDVSHVGIAVRNDDGRIHLLHSPNVGYKIQITEKPLADYLEGNKKQTGIIVVRPL